MKVIFAIFALGSLAPLMLLLPEAAARMLALFSPFISGLVAWVYWHATGGTQGHLNRAKIAIHQKTA